MSISPCTLEVLIHCHVSPLVHPRADTESVRASLLLLVNTDMVKKNDCYFSTTDKGKFYLEHLLATPFPKHTFHIPDRE